MDIEKRLRKLEAIDAVRTMVNRFRRGSDEGNDMSASLGYMTEDCVYRTVGGARLLGSDLLFEGRAAIVAAGADINKNLIVACWHHTGPVEVRLGEDGDSATVQWYLFEIAKQPSTDGSTLNVLGGWYNVILRHEDHWRACDMTLVIKFTGSAPPDWNWSD